MSLKILVGICLVLVLLSSGGCITLSGVDGKPITVEKSGEALFYVEEVMVSEEQTLHALVKGSIYGTGEAVSVFGTCLDGDDGIINGTYAVMSSWYPNGTVFFSNVSMDELETGYYLYTGAMNAVQGTYLTELRCMVNGSDQFALAWGEWQNPLWVEQIGYINESIEITWDKIDQINVTLGNVYNNLSQEIYVVGQIANNSVDRNDSYVVYLLNQIINTTTPPTPGTSVNYTESYTIPVYMKMWTITVYPIGETGRQVGYPDVMCEIETDLPTPIVDMTVQGSHFVYSVKLTRPGDLNWVINCYWL